MTTTEITKEHLNLFIVCGKHYVNSVPAEKRKENPLVPVIESVLPGMVKQLKKVERSKELFRISLCKKTAANYIEHNKNGDYQFTDKDLIKLTEELTKIDEQTIKVPCVIIEEFPEEGLSYDLRQAFEGIVIPKGERLEIEEDETEE